MTKTTELAGWEREVMVARRAWDEGFEDAVEFVLANPYEGFDYFWDSRDNPYEKGEQ